MPRLSKIGAACLAAFGFTTGGVQNVTASYLVVAGGGSGANGIGGGGGAGGLLTGTTSLNPTLSYTIVVGAGGAGSPASSSYFNGNNGSDSSAFTLTATGGGYGGTYNNTGGNGGSGGGGGTDNKAGGTGVAGQGYAGGTSNNAYPQQSGGGGGAGAVGVNATNSYAGSGGVGVASSITGTSTYYAGGGGGSFNADGSGAVGVGGNGGGSDGGNAVASNNATANTGGGSGGGGYKSSVSPPCKGSGNGGSGVVIIAYPLPQQFGGGVVTTDGTNCIHTFTTSGTLSPINSLSASYLIVAGGGAGGGERSSDAGSGGGGAGGLLSGSGLTIDTNSTYLVTVGAGGVGSGSNSSGNSGSNSSFSLVATAAVGGGYGAYRAVGGNGGSGGGGGLTNAGGTATSGQGNAGATGSGSTGGGGGGAGAAGTAGSGSTGGAGGVGVASSISGVSTYYAGGGGGGGATIGAGGNGGGGSATVNGTGNSGTANTGGGGGGVYNNNTTTYGGGNGGSGIVIISYPGSTQQMAGGTVTIVGGNVIHTFTSSGYLTPLTFVGNSLRFRTSASAYIARTPTVASSRTTWTFSAWVKRGSLSSRQTLFCGGSNGTSTDHTYIEFQSNDTIQLESYASASSLFNLQTSAVYRDPAAWYHIVYVLDTTQATSSNRVKLYINGSQVTAFSSSTYPSQNYAGGVNAVAPQRVGAYSADFGPFYFDGYMTNINFIDGQALAPTAFGTFNSYGVWQPINYGGSYGTNGFYLPFNSSRTSSYAAGFNGSSQGLITSGNPVAVGTNDFTVEFWMYLNSDPTGYTVMATGATNGIWIGKNSGNFVLRAYGVADLVLSPNLPKINNWTHIAISRTSGVAKIFFNGIQQASASTSQNFVGGTFNIGYDGGGNWTNGYLSNLRIINGTGLYTDNFTPPTTPLTSVTNTSLLTFQNSTLIDNSPNGYTFSNASGVVMTVQYPNSLYVFNDQSPQGNNWTQNNITGIAGASYDYMTDVPTLTSATTANYAVLNPVYADSAFGVPSLSNGNLKNTTGATESRAYSTIGVASGKYYFEATVGPVSNNTNDWLGISPTPPGTFSKSFLYAPNGSFYNGSAWISYGASYTNGDVIGVAFDIDNSTITFYKNNLSQGQKTGLGLTGLTMFVAVYNSVVSGNNFSLNFGQQGFTYTPPTGYVALNTFNM